MFIHGISRWENVTLVRKDHNHRVDLSYTLPSVMVLDMVPMVFPALHSQTVLYCTVLYCTYPG